MEIRAITGEELEKMLAAYNIGKKPLAKLLGWGETTVLLYAEADEIPDNEFTRRLYALSRDVQGYVALLRSNRGAITPVAYRKSMAAVIDLFKPSKILNCAQYILDSQQSGSQQSDSRQLDSRQTDSRLLGSEAEISLLRVETILFWSQIVSLCLYGRPLFRDEYRPSQSGMPYRCVEDRLRLYGCISPDFSFVKTDPELQAYIDEKDKARNKADAPSAGNGRDHSDRNAAENIPPEGRPAADTAESAELDKTDKEIISFVGELFGWFGYSAINRLMEAERYRLCGPKSARRRRVVSVDMMRRCYREVFEQSKVSRLKDLESYMQKRINFIRRQKPE